MEKLITPKEIVKFLELQKQKAELQLKIDIIKDSDQKKSESLKEILEKVNLNLEKLKEQMGAADITLTIPNQDKIADYTQKLVEYTNEEIISALSSKTGEVYDLLKQRGKYLKNNYENRENIAKLSILLAKIDKQTTESILTAVRTGTISSPISFKKTDEFHKDRISLFLQRMGVKQQLEDTAKDDESDVSEVVVEISNRKVWVSKKLSERLSEILKKMQDINPKLQLKNAERQIREFDDEEEKQFSSMQQEYLKLLKEQDVLLKDFYDEDKIEIEINHS